MRQIPGFEKKQRGCQYCKDMHVKNFSGATRTACPFLECPYSVLDKYNTYEEFMASEDSKILVNEFFATVATVYELSANPAKTKCLFSDGSSKCFL
jgi:hypothetical protein